MYRIEFNQAGSTIVLVTLLTASLIFAGCGGDANDGESPGAQGKTEATEGSSYGISTETLQAARAGGHDLDQGAAHLASMSPQVRLGARLFLDNRLSNPGANLAASCRTCHVPPALCGGAHRWTDGHALSIMPANERGGKLTTRRNTPSIEDAAVRTALNRDGAFTSLDDLLRHELTSEHMGWLPGDADRALNEIHALVLNDTGEDAIANGSYIEEFKAAKDIDVEAMDRDAVIDEVIGSLKDYLATAATHNTAAYDAFMFMNRFNEGLAGEGDTPQGLSGRIFGRIANQEGRVLIRFPNVYNEAAYQGFKVFMRVAPTYNSTDMGMQENIGNCIACHVPPKFTDGKFHNIGVTQTAYDALHGEGAFATFEPGETSRATASPAAADDPARADLGRWNVEQSDENLAAFATPPLRHITQTGPYMHNGAYDTLEAAIRQHLDAAALAKEGKLRNADPELLKINIGEEDVQNLLAFFETLNGVPDEQYRDYRITDVRIRQDPLGEQTYDN